MKKYIREILNDLKLDPSQKKPEPASSERNPQAQENEEQLSAR